MTTQSNYLNPLKCSVCGESLKGNLDTYGSPQEPVCYAHQFWGMSLSSLSLASGRKSVRNYWTKEKR